MSAVFVTATGTGIGKTFVTAGLVRHLRDAGRDTVALKPVVTGYDGPLPTSDPGILLEAMGESSGADAVSRITPWRFKAPLSPDMAAMREEREINFDELVSFCRTEAARHDIVLIEGVGGVMVPLGARHTVLDWMAALDAPVVLVAGSYLGTLSHTLTAADALARAGIKVQMLVINDSGDGAVPLTDSAATLHRFLPRLEVAILPRGASDLDFAPLVSAFLRGKAAR
jgi:dethiobiotin synthetase